MKKIALLALGFALVAAPALADDQAGALGTIQNQMNQDSHNRSSTDSNNDSSTYTRATVNNKTINKTSYKAISTANLTQNTSGNAFNAAGPALLSGGSQATGAVSGTSMASSSGVITQGVNTGLGSNIGAAQSVSAQIVH